MPIVGVDHARRRPRRGWTCRRRWRRAARSPCRGRRAGRRRGGPPHRRSRRPRPRMANAASSAGSSASCRPWIAASSERSADSSVRWCRSCSGTAPPCASASAAAMRAKRAFSSLPAQLLLAGEGEDAVGLLGELDGTEARQDGHEEDGRDEGLHVAAARGTTTTRSSGTRRCRRRTRSRRAARHRGGECRRSPRARARTARQHRRRGRVGELERRTCRASRHRCPAIAADRAKIRIFDPVDRDARRLGRDLRAAHGEHRAARRRALQRVDHERDEPEHREEQQDLLLELAEVDLGRCDRAVHSSLCTRRSLQPVQARDRRASARGSSSRSGRCRWSRSTKGTRARKNATRQRARARE